MKDLKTSPLATMASTTMLPSTQPMKSELVIRAWIGQNEVPTVIDKPDGLADDEGLIDGWHFDGKVVHFKLRPKD